MNCDRTLIRGVEEDAAELNDCASELENLCKSKNGFRITLQARVGVLKRGLSESVFAKRGLDEGPRVAAARQSAETSLLYAWHEHVQA